MSKAFTREDDDAPEIVQVRPRPPLPEGVPNYVTPRGGRLLREEHDLLTTAVQRATGEGRQAALARLSELEGRLAITEVVEPPLRILAARLGSRVTYESERTRRRTVTLVGVDEADPDEGRIAWTSPLGRALTGVSAGDVVSLRTPRGEEEIEILELA